MRNVWWSTVGIWDFKERYMVLCKACEAYMQLLNRASQPGCLMLFDVLPNICIIKEKRGISSVSNWDNIVLGRFDFFIQSAIILFFADCIKYYYVIWWKLFWKELIQQRGSFLGGISPQNHAHFYCWIFRGDRRQATE